MKSRRDAPSMELLFAVDCLSFEMRKNEEEFIAEIIFTKFGTGVNML
jgi:hypothetical protein